MKNSVATSSTQLDYYTNLDLLHHPNRHYPTSQPLMCRHLGRGSGQTLWSQKLSLSHQMMGGLGLCMPLSLIARDRNRRRNRSRWMSFYCTMLRSVFGPTTPPSHTSHPPRTTPRRAVRTIPGMPTYPMPCKPLLPTHPHIQCVPVPCKPLLPTHFNTCPLSPHSTSLFRVIPHSQTTLSTGIHVSPCAFVRKPRVRTSCVIHGASVSHFDDAHWTAAYLIIITPHSGFCASPLQCPPSSSKAFSR